MFSGMRGPDPRIKHLRDVRKARSRFRAWSVWASGLTGAALIAVPYAGLGLPDIAWAGAAGGALAMAVLRRQDYRELATAPVPAALPRRDLSLGQRIAPLLGPRWGALVDHPYRVVLPVGSPGAPAAQRLNNAARVLPPLLDRLGPHAGELPLESEAAHRALRDLGNRLALVEKSIPMAGPDARPNLLRARDELVGRFTAGVDAYEGLTTAAAECVAAVARGGETGFSEQLTAAADRLAGLAHGYNTIHDVTNPAY